MDISNLTQKQKDYLYDNILLRHHDLVLEERYFDSLSFGSLPDDPFIKLNKSIEDKLLKRGFEKTAFEIVRSSGGWLSLNHGKAWSFGDVFNIYTVRPVYNFYTYIYRKKIPEDSLNKHSNYNGLTLEEYMINLSPKTDIYFYEEITLNNKFRGFYKKCFSKIRRGMFDVFLTEDLLEIFYKTVSDGDIDSFNQEEYRFYIDNLYNTKKTNKYTKGEIVDYINTNIDLKSFLDNYVKVASECVCELIISIKEELENSLKVASKELDIKRYNQSEIEAKFEECLEELKLILKTKDYENIKLYEEEQNFNAWTTFYRNRGVHRVISLIFEDLKNRLHLSVEFKFNLDGGISLGTIFKLREECFKGKINKTLACRTRTSIDPTWNNVGILMDEEFDFMYDFSIILLKIESIKNRKMDKKTLSEIVFGKILKKGLKEISNSLDKKDAESSFVGVFKEEIVNYTKKKNL